MAKLPPLKRIHFTELQSAPAWMQRVLTTINSFMQNVTEALDEGLDIEGNFVGQFVDLQWDGASQTFVSPLAQPAKAVLMAQIQGNGITGGTTPVWQQIGQDIEIIDIPGTTAGNSYRVRLLVL